MNIYELILSKEYNISRYVKVYDYRDKGNNIVILEAEKINPTDYIEYIYKNLKLSKNDKVFFDLTNIYGFSKKNLYEWNFICEDSTAINNEFINIEKIDWCKSVYRIYNKLFGKYLNEKLKKLQKV